MLAVCVVVGVGGADAALDNAGTGAAAADEFPDFVHAGEGAGGGLVQGWVGVGEWWWGGEGGGADCEGGSEGGGGGEVGVERVSGDRAEGWRPAIV